MKDRQNFFKVKAIFRIFLWFAAISLPFFFVLAKSQAQVISEKKPIRIETYADKRLLKEGEEISIKVWIDSELIDRVAVTVFFPKNLLELKDKLSCQDGLKKNSSCEVELPRSIPLTFTFSGISVGKFNLLIQVSGQDKKTKKEITERQLVQDVEVQAQAQWWSKLLSSPLLGVLIGGALTIITTLLTNYLQGWWAKRQRWQWIMTNLPAQLEVTRQAVLQGREAGFELWMDKLRTEGYYTELQHFAKKKRGQENLAERLLNIAFCLRDYERDRNESFRDMKKKYQNLADDLAQIIRVLNR